MERTTEGSLTTFYDYENITLRLYVDIAKSGNYSALVIEGIATKEECYEAWEKIVKKNTEVNGGFEFDVYFNNAQRYAQLIADYNVIKAYLLKLAFVIDDEAIEFLRLRGYKIDTLSKSKDKYLESIQACLRRSDNITTKIIRARNELVAMEANGEKESSTDASLEAALAHLSSAIGFHIKDDITLARFNAYREIAKKKNENNKARSSKYQ